jgi:hypothetical protein
MQLVIRRSRRKKPRALLSDNKIAFLLSRRKGAVGNSHRSVPGAQNREQIVKES